MPDAHVSPRQAAPPRHPAGLGAGPPALGPHLPRAPDPLRRPGPQGVGLGQQHRDLGAAGARRRRAVVLLQRPHRRPPVEGQRGPQDPHDGRHLGPHRHGEAAPRRLRLRRRRRARRGAGDEGPRVAQRSVVCERRRPRRRAAGGGHRPRRPAACRDTPPGTACPRGGTPCVRGSASRNGTGCRNQAPPCVCASTCATPASTPSGRSRGPDRTAGRRRSPGRCRPR